MVVLFILCLFVCSDSNAQSSQQEEKKSSVNKSDAIGFYTRSLQPSNDSIITVNDNHLSKNNILENTSPPLENVLFDYNRMPNDVQKKIDANKASGKPLLEGIEKGFRVEIKSCDTESKSKDILSFLIEDKSAVGFDLISPGVLNIYVSPSIDIDQFDDKMVSNGVEYKFLYEYFFLNK
ncbi:MAG: hypothetical protein LH629_01640 [Ignavibacteria bacterium]|nr:hypothetical protein [Ignavibacteria bacterium]